MKRRNEETSSHREYRERKGKRFYRKERLRGEIILVVEKDLERERAIERRRE